MSTRTDTERLAWLAMTCSRSDFRDACIAAYEKWGSNPTEQVIADAFRDVIDKFLADRDALRMAAGMKLQKEVSRQMGRTLDAAMDEESKAGGER